MEERTHREETIADETQRRASDQPEQVAAGASGDSERADTSPATGTSRPEAPDHSSTEVSDEPSAADLPGGIPPAKAGKKGKAGKTAKERKAAAREALAAPTAERANPANRPQTGDPVVAGLMRPGVPSAKLGSFQAEAEATGASASEDKARPRWAKPGERTAGAGQSGRPLALGGRRFAVAAGVGAAVVAGVAALSAAWSPDAVESAFYETAALVIPVMLLALLVQLPPIGAAGPRVRLPLLGLFAVAAIAEGGALWALAEGQTNTGSFSLVVTGLVAVLVSLTATVLLPSRRRDKR